MNSETPVYIPRETVALPLHQMWRWHGGLSAAYASEAGGGRARNEDCCTHAPSAEQPAFCGVADGVGGGAHGEIASSVVLAHCARALKETYSNPARLTEWLARADTEVRTAIAQRSSRSGAATLAAAWFPAPGIAYLLNVGDCRIYHLKPGGHGYAVRQLTVDQTYASLAQQPPPNGRPEDPARMVGTGAVGVPAVVKARMRSGDLLLLCSDGVHRFMTHTDIADVVSCGFRHGRLLEGICDDLVRAAKRNGSRDDASALLVLRRPSFTPRWAYLCALVMVLLFCFTLLKSARAETQSVIDPVTANEPQQPPAPKARSAPPPDPAVKRERQRAAEQQRKREQAEERARSAESEAAKLRALDQARRADAAKAARKAAAARAAAARAATARAAQARLAAEKEAARKTALRQATAREAATREAAALEAATREAAARQAAQEAAAIEAAAREAKIREAAAREAAAREAAAREAAAREAAIREAAAREAAAKEAAARDAAAKTAAAVSAQPPPRSVFRDCAYCPEVVWLPTREPIPGRPAAGPHYGLSIGYTLAVGRFKVSQSEWAACVADGGCRRRPDDWGSGEGRQPVTNVSWEDAQTYAIWLSRRTGKRYRLLTGVEWEYAALAASDVYDMQGGVSEWVENCYQYRDARNGGKVWTLECTNQMVRGGAQHGPANVTRVARSFAPHSYHDSRIGFRVARTD